MFWPFSTVVYLRCTSRAEQFLTSPRAQMTIRLPPSEKKSKSPPPGVGTCSQRKASAESDGWIENRRVTATAKRKRPSSGSTSNTGKRKKSAPNGSKGTAGGGTRRASKGSRTKKSSSDSGTKTQITLNQFRSGANLQKPIDQPQETEVIDIDDDSSSYGDDSKAARTIAPLNLRHGQEVKQRPRRSSTNGLQQALVADLMEDTDQEDEEYEFQG